MNTFISLFSLPYARAHILFTIIPSIILWPFNWRYFLRYKKTFIIMTLCAGIWGFIFDEVASPLLHVWYFNPTKNLGFSFAGLPIEEFFFLLVVPQELTAIILLIRKKIHHG